MNAIIKITQKVIIPATITAIIVGGSHHIKSLKNALDYEKSCRHAIDLECLSKICVIEGLERRIRELERELEARQ